MNFIEIFQKFKRPNGVIHIGPQLFYIRNVYMSLGLTNTIWIEPNPFFYEIGTKVISENEKLFNCNIGTKPMNYSYSINNESQSMRESQSNTILNLFKDNNLDLELYDFIYVGSQGTFDINLDDMILERFKYVALEVSDRIDKNHVTDVSNVHKYMTNLGYKRVYKVINTNLGVVFYVKKRKYCKK